MYHVSCGNSHETFLSHISIVHTIIMSHVAASEIIIFISLRGEISFFSTGIAINQYCNVFISVLSASKPICLKYVIRLEKV